MEWYWEKRSNNEYNPPQIATFLQGWEQTKGDVDSTIDPVSEVFVRELVQNFVDASRDFQPGQKPDIVPTLTFRFIEFHGEQAREVFTRLDLGAIKSQYDGIANKDEMRLPESPILKEAGAPSTLKLLVVSETGTSGMYGHWDRTDEIFDANGFEIQQKMRDALMATVRGSAGKGLGSFGEGKKAVIGISQIRTIFAYTCFDGATSENGASRRFMGGAYWQNHIYDGAKYSGFGMVGGRPSPGESRPRPYEDEEADEEVLKLALPGFAVRDPKVSHNFGTTLLFVDPGTNASEVAESIGRNWWPLIEDGTFNFEVFDAEGNKHEPIIGDELLPFIDVYRATVANHISDWSEANGEVALRITNFSSSKVDGEHVGILKLGIDLQPVVGWSRKNPDSNYSLVALIRDGMLISYQHFPLAQRVPAPFVRGVFVVDSTYNPQSETLLRRTEPPLHNKWQRSGPTIESSAKALANEVYTEIRKQVEEFRQEHIATSARLELELKLFKENFALSGARKIFDPGKVIKPRVKTPWSMLSDSANVSDNGDSRRVATASRTLQLAAGIEVEHQVEVEIGWEVLEDSSWVDPEESLNYGPIEPPIGFAVSPKAFNVFVGKVTANPAVFSWSTRPYGEAWTLRPYMKVSSAEAEKVVKN